MNGVRCVNLSRVEPIAKSTAERPLSRSPRCGFHNANYDRFALPLRKGVCLFQLTASRGVSLSAKP